MVNYMLNILEIVKELKDEERNLLSIAYKNAVGSRRTAWRAVTAYEMKEKNKVQFNLIIIIMTNNLI
jgi:14-3-3 protein epsilon